MLEIFTLDSDNDRVVGKTLRDPLPLAGSTTTHPVASLVAFVDRKRGRRGCALVVENGARVFVRGRRVIRVTEVGPGDRCIVDGREWIVGDDALPERVENADDASCAVCCENGSEERALFACPRCGVRVCEACWRSAPSDRCLTSGCDQSADLDRALEPPRPSDFVTLAPAASDAAAEGERA